MAPPINRLPNIVASTQGSEYQHPEEDTQNFFGDYDPGSQAPQDDPLQAPQRDPPRGRYFDVFDFGLVRAADSWNLIRATTRQLADNEQVRWWVYVMLSCIFALMCSMATVGYYEYVVGNRYIQSARTYDRVNDTAPFARPSVMNVTRDFSKEIVSKYDVIPVDTPDKSVVYGLRVFPLEWEPYYDSFDQMIRVSDDIINDHTRALTEVGCDQNTAERIHYHANFNAIMNEHSLLQKYVHLVHMVVNDRIFEDDGVVHEVVKRTHDAVVGSYESKIRSKMQGMFTARDIVVQYGDVVNSVVFPVLVEEFVRFVALPARDLDEYFEALRRTDAYVEKRTFADHMDQLHRELVRIKQHEAGFSVLDDRDSSPMCTVPTKTLVSKLPKWLGVSTDNSKDVTKVMMNVRLPFYVWSLIRKIDESVRAIYSTEVRTMHKYVDIVKRVLEYKQTFAELPTTNLNSRDAKRARETFESIVGELAQLPQIEPFVQVLEILHRYDETADAFVEMPVSPFSLGDRIRKAVEHLKNTSPVLNDVLSKYEIGIRHTHLINTVSFFNDHLSLASYTSKYAGSLIADKGKAVAVYGAQTFSFALTKYVLPTDTELYMNNLERCFYDVQEMVLLNVHNAFESTNRIRATDADILTDLAYSQGLQAASDIMKHLITKELLKMVEGSAIKSFADELMRVVNRVLDQERTVATKRIVFLLRYAINNIWVSINAVNRRNRPEFTDVDMFQKLGQLPNHMRQTSSVEFGVIKGLLQEFGQGVGTSTLYAYKGELAILYLKLNMEILTMRSSDRVAINNYIRPEGVFTPVTMSDIEEAQFFDNIAPDYNASVERLYIIMKEIVKRSGTIATVIQLMDKLGVSYDTFV